MPYPPHQRPPHQYPPHLGPPCHSGSPHLGPPFPGPKCQPPHTGPLCHVGTTCLFPCLLPDVANVCIGNKNNEASATAPIRESLRVIALITLLRHSHQTEPTSSAGLAIGLSLAATASGFAVCCSHHSVLA